MNQVLMKLRGRFVLDLPVMPRESYPGVGPIHAHLRVSPHEPEGDSLGAAFGSFLEIVLTSCEVTHAAPVFSTACP